jgi:hypothetical protein
MLYFNTLCQTLTANITKLSLGTVCVEMSGFSIPIKGVKTGINVNDVYVLPLTALSGEYIKVEADWTLITNLSSLSS